MHDHGKCNGIVRCQALRNSYIFRSMAFSLWKYASFLESMRLAPKCATCDQTSQTQRYILGNLPFSGLRMSRAAILVVVSICSPINILYSTELQETKDEARGSS
jgi:hypothetical protein